MPTTWMNLKKIMLSGRKEFQNVIYAYIDTKRQVRFHLFNIFENTKFRHGEQISACQEPGLSEGV